MLSVHRDERSRLPSIVVKMDYLNVHSHDDAAYVVVGHNREIVDKWKTKKKELAAIYGRHTTVPLCTIFSDLRFF